MKYFIRLNGREDLQAETEHVEQINENEVIIDDRVIFPMCTERVQITLIEIFDEGGDRWAMRRIPEAYAPQLCPACQFTFDWRLCITKESKEID